MPKMVNGKMDYSNVKILHRFPNGEVRESLEGVKLPLNDSTRLFYSLLYKILTREPSKEEKG